MPWRNGLGVTTELAREDGAGAVGFLWRLSRADVACDGAFSNFPGVDRILLLLSGAGLKLAFSGREMTLDKPYDTASFAGDEPVDCILADGACKDFNIMVDRARAKAAVTIFAAAAVERDEVSLTTLYPCGGEQVHGSVQSAPDSASSHVALGRAADRTLLHVFEGEWGLDFAGTRTVMPEDSLVLLEGERGQDYAVSGCGVLLRVNIEIF